MTSNRFFPSELPSVAPDLEAFALDLPWAPVLASRISTSSMVDNGGLQMNDPGSCFSRVTLDGRRVTVTELRFVAMMTAIR